VTAGGTAVQGTVAPGFESVGDAFERNVLERADGGCSLAAVVDGLTVVDLWGGSADAAGRPWQRDTAAVVFSGSKGVVATLLLLLCQRRLLEPTAPVADLWPEFGVAGKDRITVAQLFAHAGGVPGLLEPIDRSQLAHPEQLAARIAADPPLTEPGLPCYHALTYGWLAAEVVRRVDGRSIGRLLADKMADYVSRMELRTAVRDRVSETIASLKLDAVVLPYQAVPPPSIDAEADASGDRSNNFTSATGLPGIIVPGGYTKNNLPVAIQFVGQPWTDLQLLQVAYAYEQNSKRRAPPATTPELPGEKFDY